MRILQFTSENFMRLSVVQITPQGNLIQITGSNSQGKTSVIDSIWAALGGKDAVPADPIHKGKKAARIEVKLGDDSGTKLIVERTFTDKGTYLTVKGPEGGKFAKPQQIMDGLMGAIGFDPLAFMRMDAKAQFAMLRQIVPLEVDIDALDRKRASIFEARTALNRTIAQAKTRADAITFPDDLPDEAPDRDEVMERLTNVSAHNQAIHAEALQRGEIRLNLERAGKEVERLEAELRRAKQIVGDGESELSNRERTPLGELINGADVRTELESAERILEGIRQRQAKIDADGELTTLTREQAEKTSAIEAIDAQKTAAITTAKMPVEGLAFHVAEGESFSDGTVVYNGHPLRQASGAEQLAVSASIGAALNPQLKVLLCRDGSLLDSKSLAALGAFAEKSGMQVFLERVDETGEIGVVIEDGHVKGQEALVAQFLKEEAAEADKPAPEGSGKKEAVVAPDPDRLARAQAYLTGQVVAVGECKSAKDCDRLNASVKHMLRAFPDMFRDTWMPAYQARVAALTKKD